VKRYLIFGGEMCYPAGGWNDLLGNTDSLDDAMEAALVMVVKGEWAHILDTERMELIFRESS